MKRTAVLALAAVLALGPAATPVYASELQAEEAMSETFELQAEETIPEVFELQVEENMVYAESNRAQVQNFVSRMYTVALGRDAEAEGLTYWTDRLVSHEITGADTAYGFIMSQEFTNKNLDDSAYLDVLYGTFFDRAADEGGKSYWQSALASGQSRSYVLAGFVNSDEFSALCERFGIERGTMAADGTAQASSNTGVRSFVERMYTKALNRAGEDAGINDWTNRITSGSMSAEDVAKSFFASEEFCNRNLSNADYVETLYQTFMDRASDEAGKADWVNRLNNGTDRNEVLEGFSRSAEFAAIMESYGLGGSTGATSDSAGGSADTGSHEETIYVVSREKLYRANGRLYAYEELEYDASGNYTQIKYYYADGSLRYNYVYEYDASGKQIKTMGYNGDGSLWYYADYAYDDAGNMTRSTNYNADGSLWQYIDYSYDDAGNKTSYTVYNADGSVYAYCSGYEYGASGNCTKNIYYNADGSVKWYTEYAYNDVGNATRFTRYYADGSLYEYGDYEYTAITVTR